MRWVSLRQHGGGGGGDVRGRALFWHKIDYGD